MSTPQQIGRYQVLERIGFGGFATVWHAYDAELANDVAVKILAENWAARPDVRTRFVEEARMLRQADSDRVVRVYDIGTLEDGRPYFVMSYGDRGSLADLLSAGPLQVRRALWYAGQVARGVAVLHDLGIVHRDIKPSNVIIRGGAEERLMVADLGLAKAIAHASGFTVAAGTPGYMAPEQNVAGSDVDRRADVYAIGALTYQLLTGQRPAPAGAGQAVAPPSRLRPGLPHEVDALVMRALHPDRRQRWPDARLFADTADGLLRSGGLSRPEPDRPVTTVPSTTPTAAPAAQPTRSAQPTQARQFVSPPPSPWSPDPVTVHSRGSATPRRRKVLIGLSAGVVVVAALLVAGYFYWPSGWVTVQSEDGAIKARVPRSWVKVDPQSRTIDNAYAYGGSGKATLLDVGANTWQGQGVVIVADKDLGSADPANVLEFGTDVSWPGGKCKEKYLESRLPRGEHYDTGVMWTFQPACSAKPRYAEAVLVGPRKRFGANVLIAGDDASRFAEIAESVEVDEAKLPDNT